MLKGISKNNPPQIKKTLWHLFLGVNQTPPQQTQIEALKYAAADCQEIATIFDELKPIAPGEIYRPIILHDGEDPNDALSASPVKLPTKDNILQCVDNIINKAQGEDRILVYITGHAICDVDSNPYLIVTDSKVKKESIDKEAEIDLGSTLSLNELIDKLGQKKVKEVVLLIDTCHSGLVDLPDFKIAREPDLFYIICSSRSIQSSYEIELLKHSLFSYYLISALCGEVKNQSRETTANALYDYLKTVIPWHLNQIKQQTQLSLSTQGKTSVVEDIEQQPTRKISGKNSDAVIALGVRKSFNTPTHALILSDHQILRSKLVDMLKTTEELEVVQPDLTSNNSIAIDEFFQGEGTRILYYRGKLAAEIIDKLENNLVQSKKVKPILLIEAIESEKTELDNWLTKLKSATQPQEQGLAFIGFNNTNPENHVFIAKLIALLEIAKLKNAGLTVAKLMTELQSEIGQINPLKLWLSGDRGILEIIPTPKQNKTVSNIYELLTTWRIAAKKMIPEWLTTNPLKNMSRFNVNDIYVPLGLANRLEIERIPTNNVTEKDYDCFPHCLVKGSEKYNNEDFLTTIIGEGKSLSKGKRIAIVGEPGSGKTTYLQRISQWLFAHTQAIPIWISLPNLQHKSLSDYLEIVWLKEAYGVQEVTEEMKQGFLQFAFPNIYLLLDGLDEACRANPNLLTNLDNELNNRFSSIKVVLSVRSNFWNTSNKLWQFDSYKTLPFEEAQIAEFIDKYFADLPEKSDNLKSTLKQTENLYLYDLVKNPLRLMMLCNTWRLRAGKLPKTQAALYKVFCNGFYNFQSKEIDQATQDRLHQALGKSALWALNNPQIGFRLKSENIPSELTKEIGYYDQEKSLLWWALKLGWVNTVGVNEDNPEELIYAFFHPTFQEFFAANSINSWSYFLHHNSLEPNPLKDYLGKKSVYKIFDTKWRQTLIFWFGREEITLQHKQEFIEALLSFEDGCHEDNWYGVKATLLATTAWQTLKKLSFPDDKSLEDLSKKIQSRLSSFTNMTTYIIKAIAFYNINSDPAKQYLTVKLNDTNDNIRNLARQVLNSLSGEPKNQNIPPQLNLKKYADFYANLKKLTPAIAVGVFKILLKDENSSIRDRANKAVEELLNSDLNFREEFIKIAKNNVQDFYNLIWLCVQKMPYSTFYSAWNSHLVSPPAIDIDLNTLLLEIKPTADTFPILINLINLTKFSTAPLTKNELSQLLANQIYLYLDLSIPDVSDGIKLQQNLLNVLRELNKKHLALIVYNQAPSPDLIDLFKAIVDAGDKLCLAWVTNEPLDKPLVNVPMQENLGAILESWIQEIEK